MRCESVSALVRRKTTKRQKEPSRIYRFKVRLNVVVQEGEDLMNEKKKAWIYTRIDAPEDQYGSLKRQDQKLTEYASRMGWEVVGHSQDTGSCWDMNRPPGTDRCGITGMCEYSSGERSRPLEPQCKGYHCLCRVFTEL